MHMASENDPGILVPTEDDDITLESPLSILEAPEPSPRRIRIPRPRLPQHIPEAALLKWGPWVIGIGCAIALIILTLTAIPSWGSIAARDGITLLLAGIGAGVLIWLFYRLHHRWAQRSWLALTASLLLVGIVGIAL